ncbi:MAG: TfpX/TfpZ family type IV pilin accessory protein [Methylococcaceae bacterium]|nr:TfpX/TfpZ family type IV pilin accessory protein [Methylococcaceae bacterium]
MSRWKASAIHLGISALVAFTLAVLLALTWYPPSYVWAVGGLGLIAIFAGVDVTLGPLLTLIVWNVKKISLRSDMAVIVLLQLLAMGYGLHAIFLARPVYLVFAVDRFDLVSAADIPEGETEQATREEYRSLPLTGPKIVAAQKPADGAERNKLLFSALSGGADLPQLPRYYLPYADLSAEAVRKAQPLAPLMRRDAETRDTLLAYLESHRLDPSQVKFLPLRAKKRDQTVIIDAANGAVLGIVDLDPWQ